MNDDDDTVAIGCFKNQDGGFKMETEQINQLLKLLFSAIIYRWNIFSFNWTAQISKTSQTKKNN